MKILKKMIVKSIITRFKFLNIFAIMFISVLFSPQYLMAQDSLTNYLTRSAQNNPALKSSYSQYLASLQMIPQVGSLPDPEMTFGFFIKPEVEIMGKQNADIRFMQMFPWFGTLTSAKDEAAQMAKARFQEFSEARNKLFYDVKSLYYQLYTLRKETTLAEENLKFLKTYEKLALIRFKTGSNVFPNSGTQSNPEPSSAEAMPKGVGLIDVLRVQMDIKDLENTLAYLNDKRKPLVSRFNSYLNRSFSSDVSLPDTLTAISIDTTLNVLTDSIISNNPMLKMYSAEQESYKAKMEKSRLMGLPMFGIGIDYMLLSRRTDISVMNNGSDMIMPMVNLTLPIYRKKYTAMRKEAEYMLNSSKYKQSNVLNNLKVDMENALLNLNNAARNIDLFNSQTRLARQSLSVLTSTYSTAGIDLVEVLRMQQKLLDYQFKLVEAVVDQNTEVANIGYLISKKIVTDDYLISKN